MYFNFSARTLFTVPRVLIPDKILYVKKVLSALKMSNFFAYLSNKLTPGCCIISHHESSAESNYCFLFFFNFFFFVVSAHLKFAIKQKKLGNIVAPGYLLPLPFGNPFMSYELSKSVLCARIFLVSL